MSDAVTTTSTSRASRTFWWHPSPPDVTTPAPEAGTFWWHPSPPEAAPSI